MKTLCYASFAMLTSLILSTGCSSKKEITDVDTKLEETQSLGNETVGKNTQGDYVAQKKEDLASYLLTLQRDVYTKESEIYGNKTYGNKGKYGVLEDCRIELRAKASGRWEMVEKTPKAILTKESNTTSRKIGKDEKGQIVMLSEEEITKRIKRFERYNENYEDQIEWFDTEIKACQLSLNNYSQTKKVEPQKNEDFPKIEVISE